MYSQEVEQAANFVPILEKNEKVIGHKTELGSTKTVCSIREVPIPDILVEALYEWYDKQKLAGVNNKKITQTQNVLSFVKTTALLEHILLADIVLIDLKEQTN